MALWFCEAVADGRRGQARTRAEGRFAGFVSELERYIDAIHDSGVRVKFGAFNEKEVARAMHLRALNTPIDQLAPLVATDAFLELWRAMPPPK